MEREKLLREKKRRERKGNRKRRGSEVKQRHPQSVWREETRFVNYSPQIEFFFKITRCSRTSNNFHHLFSPSFRHHQLPLSPSLLSLSFPPSVTLWWNIDWVVEEFFKEEGRRKWRQSSWKVWVWIEVRHQNSGGLELENSVFSSSFLTLLASC